MFGDFFPYSYLETTCQSYSTWEQAKAAAMANLNKAGKGAKIPEPKASIAKFRADMEKADKEYDAAVDVLQTKILNLQNGYSTMKNVLKQFQDQIAKTNFGIKSGDTNAQIYISTAQDILDGYLDDQMGNMDINIKNLDELDKHSMAISKYQSK